MSYWIRQLGLIVLGLLLSGGPLEMPSSGPESSPSATRSAPESGGASAGSPIRLCLRTSVAPLGLDVQVRTRGADEYIKSDAADRAVTVCLGAGPPPEEPERSTTDD